jgi:hypothetical protein
MRNALPTTLAILIMATSACSEATTQPTAVETEALLATSTEWSPIDLTRDLQVDDVTRANIEAGVQALHTSMLDLHERYESAQSLAGDARAAQIDDIEADLRALHEQHIVLWNSLDPAVKKTLAERMHEQMGNHHADDAGSLHDRMRRLHGGDHGPDGVGH